MFSVPGSADCSLAVCSHESSKRSLSSWVYWYFIRMFKQRLPIWEKTLQLIDGFFFCSFSGCLSHFWVSKPHVTHLQRFLVWSLFPENLPPKKTHVSLTSQWDRPDIRDVAHHFFDQVMLTSSSSLEMDGVWRMRGSSVCHRAAVAFLHLLSILQMDILILLPNTFSSTSPSFPSVFILISFLFPFLLNFLSPSFLNTITFFSHSHPVSHQY